MKLFIYLFVNKLKWLINKFINKLIDNKNNLLLINQLIN